jgi:6-phosphofructokinase 1
MVLEVMGRDTGWLATYSGLANGADEILIPEIPVTEEKLDSLCDKLKARRNRGINFSIIVVAEGAKLLGHNVIQEGHSEGSPAPRLGGVGQLLGEILEQKTGIETRVSTLGYIQRGGTPVAYDRTLATAFGVKATNLIKQKRYGTMTALKGTRIVGSPLERTSDGTKLVDMHAFNVASKFFA